MERITVEFSCLFHLLRQVLSLLLEVHLDDRCLLEEMEIDWCSESPFECRVQISKDDLLTLEHTNHVTIGVTDSGDVAKADG